MTRNLKGSKSKTLKFVQSNRIIFEFKRRQRMA